MNRIRVAVMSIFSALVLAPVLSYAQGPPAGTPGADQNLATRLSALEARVAKLESGQVTAADMVGTYVFHLLGIETNGANAGVPPRISTEAGGSTMTLHANGGVSGSFVEGRCTLSTFAGGTVTCSGDTGGSTTPIPGLAWTVNNGKLIVTEEGDENMELLIGAGGRVLTGGGTSTGGVNHGWSAIVVMVKLPTQ